MEIIMPLLLAAGTAVLMVLPIVIFMGKRSPSVRKFFAGIFPKKDTEYKKITNSNFEIKGTVLIKYLGVNPDLYDDGDDEFRYIEIPQGLTEIGEEAFVDAPDARAIRSVVIPEGVKVIGENAFAGLRWLKWLKISESVTTIGARAFAGTGLSSAEIPAAVTLIGEDAFFASNFRAFKVDRRNQHFSSAGGVLFDKAGKTLLSFPAGKGALSYAVPSGVTAIGVSAFARHSSNTADTSSVDGNSGKAYIYAVRFPAGLRSIGEDALAGTQISSIKLPAGLRSIGERALAGTRISSIKLPASLTVISARTFYGTPLKSVQISSSVTVIGEEAFAYCRQLISISIPESVESIGKDAFAYCKKLRTVELSRRTKVDKTAFSGCPRLDLRYRD